MNAPKPMKVLLVEDGLANQRLAVALLTKWGFGVELAQDGQQAVERCAPDHDFDVILMDLQMPVLDGFEATRQIREFEKNSNKRVPILAMTARDSRVDREQCQLAGMDGYLAKPIRQQDLLDALQHCQRTAAGIPSLIDWPAAMKNFEDDTDIMLAVLEASLIELPELTEKLEKQFASDDRHDVQRLAHTIKASARAFPSPVMMQAAFAVEFAAANLDWEAAEEKFESLKPLVQQFLAELRSRQ
jgi:two-component system sensor histidine kinase/response regulator